MDAAGVWVAGSNWLGAVGLLAGAYGPKEAHFVFDIGRIKKKSQMKA